MTRLVLLLGALACAFPAPAEKKITEITKATTPHDDAKPNSAAVPEAYAITGQFERIVVLRFKYEADLLAGMQRLVNQQGIRNAVILSGVGSLRNSHVHSVSNRTFPSKNRFVEDPDTPADIIGVNGYVIEGRIHAHMTLSNGEQAYGGHIEPGNRVFTFAIVTLGVFGREVSLDKTDDKTYR